MYQQEKEQMLKFIQETLPDESYDLLQVREHMERINGTLPIRANIQLQEVNIEQVQCEWVWGPEATDDRVMIYFHGGGYQLGSINTHRGLVSEIVHNCTIKGLSVNYRLAPENLFPAPLEDGMKVYRWLLDHGFDAKNIILAGDSAGGGLIIALLVAIRNEGMPLPAAGIALCPWADLACSGQSAARNKEVDLIDNPDILRKMGEDYLGSTNAKEPLASPIYADLQGLPPLLIQVGQLDILLDDALTLAKHGAYAGVKVRLDFYPNMPHVWHHYYSFSRAARKAIDEITCFMERLLEEQENE